MPVFKIKQDGVWQEVAGVSGNLHNYAGSSSAGGAANSVANALSIQIIGGDLSGSDIGSSTMSEFNYDGSKAQSVKVANATHTHVAYETFVVTVTGNNNEGYTSDKTFEDISFAIGSGKMVVAKLEYDGNCCYAPIREVSNSIIIFSSWSAVGITDNSFTISMNSVGDVVVDYPADWKPVEVKAVKDAETNTVTVTATYSPLIKSVSVITLDDNGDPVSVTKDGVTTTLSWEGFDES